MSAGLTIEFCGEYFHPDPAGSFRIGREGELAVDDNPYLHRHFLQISRHDNMWWLHNIGGSLAATVSDDSGGVQAWISPGAALPLVFGTSVIRFTAGPTLYELTAHLADAPYLAPASERAVSAETTIGRVDLTADQKLLLVALAERALGRGTTGATSLPSSAAAAERLGWPITRFNRKLDNVCSKLERAGVRGLHGDSGSLASGRRARLVEYAIAARIVTNDDVTLLDLNAEFNRKSPPPGNA